MKEKKKLQIGIFQSRKDLLNFALALTIVATGIIVGVVLLANATSQATISYEYISNGANTSMIFTKDESEAISSEKIRDVRNALEQYPEISIQEIETAGNLKINTNGKENIVRDGLYLSFSSKTLDNSTVKKIALTVKSALDPNAILKKH